jgi:hypothetical protein
MYSLDYPCVVARNESGRLSDLPETHGLRVPLLVRSDSRYHAGEREVRQNLTPPRLAEVSGAEA